MWRTVPPDGKRLPMLGKRRDSLTRVRDGASFCSGM